MKLNSGAFNRHINHMGQRMLWRQSFACPCISEHSGAADPACPLCRGKGRVWDNPIEGLAGISTQQANPQNQDFGQLMQGDATLTVGSDSPIYEIGRFDRVTLLNSTDTFSRTLVRGVNDNLSDLEVVSITRVFWIDSGVIVDGGIPSVSSSGDLSWDAGEPAFGHQYSITGRRYDSYFVWDKYPSDRNEHSGSPLPKKVMIRFWDLYGR